MFEETYAATQVEPNRVVLCTLLYVLTACLNLTFKGVACRYSSVFSTTIAHGGDFVAAAGWLLVREALDRAREAAAGMDVRTGGGPDTIRQYLREGLIDELHIAIAPVLLGRGESLFEGIDLRALGYECVEFVASDKATHVVLRG
ncbi:RibD domain-containing protein OS=Eoetvoesiella caeni OX=645616 GN=DFR37_107165 PE=4 SV=1 [Eoetvoesiella caeni]|uniref:RibD domain-containing protein n=1 Tax=Eoetvoesiella caeni TaxID=645616 RepID=A0A366H884_9BURK|nr:dihydrofolate reductase family protein [Eoetvoesiella caeni]MCI2809741.1 dihydrofolate reductase family protein [Eoetvoesiella caeni]RBP38401.1 RibD domain-containing protein [Eoetvoesiella caeni]